MKKLLLICFLVPIAIGICLPISTLTAQVADPPGADLLLHRSMPHRGGDSRSDTFLKLQNDAPASILPPNSRGLSSVDNGPNLPPTKRIGDTPNYQTSQEIDGGPFAINTGSNLVKAKKSQETVASRLDKSIQRLHPNSRGLSSVDSGLNLLPARCGGSSVCPPWRVSRLLSQKKFSLIDSDQGMRIGSEHSSFQSASVSVFDIPIHSDRKSDPQKPSSQSLDSCVLGLDTSICLVDDAISLGQGSLGSSAHSQGKDLRKKGMPIVVYGEIRSGAMPDSLLVTFWEKYLGRHVSYVGMESKYVMLQEGSMLQGASGKKVLHYESMPISGEGYISIASVLGDQYMDRFLVEPGDSLIFSLDLRLGQLVFAGPDALKFELQHRLAKEENKVSFMEIPAFHLQAGQDPIVQERSFMDRSPLVEGYAPRTMEFISFGSERREWIEERLKKEVLEDARLSVLEEYRGSLSDNFLDILQADVLGENASKSISLIKNLPLESKSESQELLEEYLKRIGNLYVSAAAAEASAFYQEYLLERESLLAFYAGEGLFSRLEALFSGLAYDRLVGRFLFENYYRLPDFEHAVSRVTDRISDPEIRSGLESLAAAHRVGSLVKDLPLIDLNGDSTDLEAYRGKTLLLAFWFPGCLPSKLMHEGQLSKVQKELEGREDFALLSINTDPDPVLWKTYLSENPSYSFGNEHLFLGGRDMHPFLKYYDIQAYPSLMLIDGEGKLIRSLKMPSKAEELIALIQENLSDENH